ncbi:MAG TPA: glutamate--tRNA ligase family protein, partial [Verrucomicrobiae bacterium]|nr:glutamate--tRNA ligase family protein [Verrucomicrobiae bacterium]
FHLAVCVDDALMKVTHVVRGEDHLSNTPKHILLLKAMGYTPPQYGHLSLVHGKGGEPLSKRLDSISIHMFRRRGYMPEALANYIALLGWSPGENREIVGWDELQKIFDISRVSKSSSNYDDQKLDWVNGQHFRHMPTEEFVKRAFAYLKEQKMMEGLDEKLVLAILPVLQDNIERFEQLGDRLTFLKDDFGYENEGLVKSAEAREIFEQALQVLPGVTGAAETLYDNFLNALKPRVKAKGKNLFMPLRVALTGREHGPELKRLFPALGMDRIKRRFQRTLG